MSHVCYSMSRFLLKNTETLQTEHLLLAYIGLVFCHNIKGMDIQHIAPARRLADHAI